MIRTARRTLAPLVMGLLGLALITTALASWRGGPASAAPVVTSTPAPVSAQAKAQAAVAAMQEGDVLPVSTIYRAMGGAPAMATARRRVKGNSAPQT